ncbi:MAG: hypothetical protein OWT27_02060, partial [Firmicutes bacterium]|nr:hypothetical protein [Bacillota bacterium]
MSRSSRWTRVLGSAILCFCLALVMGAASVTSASAAAAPQRAAQAAHARAGASPRDRLADRKPVIRVMIIGSSVAQGWKDDRGGYLRRAFRHLSRIDHIDDRVISRAVPGIGAGLLEAHIPGWIETVQPQVVIIAWGGLDDAYEHTPLDVFRELIREQVLDA